MLCSILINTFLFIFNFNTLISEPIWVFKKKESITQHKLGIFEKNTTIFFKKYFKGKVLF